MKWRKYLWFRERAGTTARPGWFDHEAVNAAIDSSPALGIFAMVILWAVAALLLTLSARQQRELVDWMDGQKAPYSIYAAVDFSYLDTAATAAARKDAADQAPEFFRIDSKRSAAISRNFAEFFIQLESWADARKNRSPYQKIPGSLPSELIASASPALLEALLRESITGESFMNLHSALRRLLGRGILSEADKDARKPGRQLRTIDDSGRTSQSGRTVEDFPDPDQAAALLAMVIFPRDDKMISAFANLAEKLIGAEGTLEYDPVRSDESRAAALAAVQPVQRDVARGAQLIGKGEPFTSHVREMLAAEHAESPHLGLETLFHNMLWSLILILVSLFFLYQVFPEALSDNLGITMAALVIIVALTADYAGIKVFEFFAREGWIPDNGVLPAALPVTLAAVILSVLIGLRSAMCGAFLVCSLSAMMIMPERSFELALRWLAISVPAALVVSRVGNYRSYFIRIFIFVFIAVLLTNLDAAYRADQPLEVLRSLIYIALANGFVTAMLALVMIFALELIFNVTTDMSLMVLCDGSHPLLERLKREADGTMHHSMMVATLAEDAARAIGANPLRAKAGALFHDIGKLVRPRFFIENNRDNIDKHLHLNPQMSTIIIRDHVKEGLALARQYRMCRLVRDAIATHHGDDLVRYFYAKAVAERGRSGNGGPQVLESQFRYNGTPPVSRELTIVSLADACEAACRSLPKPTPDKIRALVDEIFVSRMRDGQLRNSRLTLHELDMVRESFIATLIGINHGRIAYPDSPEH